MSELPIKELKEKQAREMDFSTYDISLKVDGALLYYIDGELISPRCNRSERFKHILEILKTNNFSNCMGEMYVDKPFANVFDVSRKENWKKAKFMIFSLIDKTKSYREGQKILFDKIEILGNPFITNVIRFEDFNEGWEYVLKNKSEGLVIRNENYWFKVKSLQEKRVKIKSWEEGVEKGCFILEDGNKVSGTSMEFVNTFLENKENSVAEVEFAFYTTSNRMFHPRLRKIEVVV